MSAALLDETTATLEEEPRELLLDAVTRQRLEVAACAVDTLEELADTGAWDRLDPAVADHLVEHAKRLVCFLERVRQLRAVRDCEQEMLAVRRTERRLEVALDLLVEEEELESDGVAAPDQPRRKKKTGAAGEELFLGDFREMALTAEQREKVRERRQQRKEARKFLSPRAKRILLYVTGCIMMTIASAFMVALGALQGKPASSTQTLQKEPMVVNEYLEDVRVFLPAKMVMVHDNTAVVMVEREWLLKTPEQRQVDADGAHVYLSNRAITSIELLWADGGLIGRAGKDEKVAFADGTTGLIGKKGSSDDDGGGAPPGLAGPGAP